MPWGGWCDNKVVSMYRRARFANKYQRLLHQVKNFLLAGNEIFTSLTIDTL